LGKTFAEMVKRRPHFELGVEPESNIVCFRYIEKGKNNTELNALNSEKRAEILRGGRFYIVQTTLREKVFLRVSLMNPLTSENDLEALLDEIE
jgi:L-2,4-diaminobutyrate decarboxylase